VLGETAEVADRDSALDLAVSAEGDAVGGEAVGGEAVGGSAGAAAAVVTELDRFLSAGLSQEAFDLYQAAGRIAVAGRPVMDPATPAPPPTAVAITLDPR
jgi:hypothetical protein